MDTLRERVATNAGLTFHKCMRGACDIPLSGATKQAYDAISEIDPRVWESICYAVADSFLVPLRVEVQEIDGLFPETIMDNAKAKYWYGEGFEKARQAVLKVLE